MHDTSSSALSALRERVGPSENILWAGAPDTGRLFGPGDLVAALLGLALSLSLMVGGLQLPLGVKGASRAPLIFGLLVFAIGAALAVFVIRTIANGRPDRVRTSYGFTKDRVLFLWGETFASLPLNEYLEVRRTGRSVQFRDLTPFEPRQAPPASGSTVVLYGVRGRFAFIDIEGAQSVADQILALSGRPASRR